MQKKIVALAVAGLSTAAFAQTNVTIYGVADVSGQGFNQSNVKGGNSANGYNGGNVFGIQSNSSLIGFKGTEDLGNGLKALFQIETEVNLAGNRNVNNTSSNSGVAYGTKTSIFTGARDTYLGVSSKYGNVMAGYMSTPVRSFITGYDVMPGATGSSDPTVQMASVRVHGNGYSTAIRATALAYAMPTLYGFDGSIVYTGSNLNGTTNTVDSSNCSGAVSACSITPVSAFGFNLGWTGYGVNIKGAFQQNNNQNTPSAASAGNAGNYGDYTSYMVGAGYTG
jgi:predicted porin